MPFSPQAAFIIQIVQITEGSVDEEPTGTYMNTLSNKTESYWQTGALEGFFLSLWFSPALASITVRITKTQAAGIVGQADGVGWECRLGPIRVDHKLEAVSHAAAAAAPRSLQNYYRPSRRVDVWCEVRPTQKNTKEKGAAEQQNTAALRMAERDGRRGIFTQKALDQSNAHAWSPRV